MTNYDAAMLAGTATYAHALTALRDEGLAGFFTQTGGMCAALQVDLESGYYLLVTDRDDTLSWSLEEHVGWWVGLYPPEDCGAVGQDGPMSYAYCDDSDVPGLLMVTRAVLAEPRGGDLGSIGDSSGL